MPRRNATVLLDGKRKGGVKGTGQHRSLPPYLDTTRPVTRYTRGGLAVDHQEG